MTPDPQTDFVNGLMWIPRQFQFMLFPENDPMTLDFFVGFLLAIFFCFMFMGVIQMSLEEVERQRKWKEK
jgi:hypothetical protein